MTTYYGIKLKGKVCEFLENFADFHYIPNVSNTGFLGIEVKENTQYVLEKILFPKLVEDFRLIFYRSNFKDKEKLVELLKEYADLNKEPIFWKKTIHNNYYYNTFEEFEKSNV